MIHFIYHFIIKTFHLVKESRRPHEVFFLDHFWPCLLALLSRPYGSPFLSKTFPCQSLPVTAGDRWLDKYFVSYVRLTTNTFYNLSQLEFVKATAMEAVSSYSTTI